MSDWVKTSRTKAEHVSGRARIKLVAGRYPLQPASYIVRVDDDWIYQGQTGTIRHFKTVKQAIAMALQRMERAG